MYNGAFDAVRTVVAAFPNVKIHAKVHARHYSRWTNVHNIVSCHFHNETNPHVNPWHRVMLTPCFVSKLHNLVMPPSMGMWSQVTYLDQLPNLRRLKAWLTGSALSWVFRKLIKLEHLEIFYATNTRDPFPFLISNLKRLETFGVNWVESTSYNLQYPRWKSSSTWPALFWLEANPHTKTFSLKDDQRWVVVESVRDEFIKRLPFIFPNLEILHLDYSCDHTYLLIRSLRLLRKLRLLNLRTVPNDITMKHITLPATLLNLCKKRGIRLNRVARN